MYYIYAWVILPTFEVFYIGRGHGDRYKSLKDRTKYFHKFYDNYPCTVIIFEKNLTEEQAIIREQEYIAYYRSINMAQANIHNGGQFGGDVITHMPEENRQVFINKMTEINRKRCSSDDFKEKARQRMIEKYSDPKERELQSIKIKKAWSNPELIQAQSNARKQYAIEHPEVIQAIARSHYKKCIFELNGEKIEFESLKDLKAYLKNTYGLVLSRAKEQDMLYNRTPYITDRSKYNYLIGFKIYYV